MQSNLSLVANFVDNSSPTLAVTSPAANSTVTNATVTLQGTANDNTGVNDVLYSHNGGAFQNAIGTTSWSAPLTLKPKTNIVQIKCVDIGGNESATISHTIYFSSKGQMRLSKRGKGTVTPDLDSQMLEIGSSYSLSAVPSTGYTFADWTGSVTSTNARLTFVMQTNYNLTARFVDVAKPTLTIVSPAAGARLTNGVATFTGRATDNEGVAQVLYSLNGGPFESATGSSNWAAS